MHPGQLPVKSKDPSHDPSPRRRARRLREPLPDVPQAELFLEAEAGDEPLDRDRVLRALGETGGLRAASKSRDEWIDEDGGAHILVTADRVLLRMELLVETTSELTVRLDSLLDVAFALAERLRVDVRDPAFDTIVSRSRVDRVFPRLLDHYLRLVKTEAALRDPSVWKVFHPTPAAPSAGASLPAFETEPATLPTAIWSRTGRSLGILQLSGERTLAAVQALDPACPILVVVSPGAKVGDDAALVRILRVTEPLPGTAVVEAVTAGVASVDSIDRTVQPIRIRVR